MLMLSLVSLLYKCEQREGEISWRHRNRSKKENHSERSIARQSVIKMDPFNSNSERVQHDNSATNSAGNLMRRHANRHQIVMIPTPSINYTAEAVQPITSQSITNAGTNSVHQSDKQGHNNAVISSPMTSNNPPAMSYSNAGSTPHTSTPTMTSSQASAPCRSLTLAESNPPVPITNRFASLAKSNSQTSTPFASHSVAGSNSHVLTSNPSPYTSISITRGKSQAVTPNSSPALTESSSNASTWNPSLSLARSNSQTPTLNSPLSLAKSNSYTLTPNPSLAPARSNSHTPNASLSLARSNSQASTLSSLAPSGSNSQTLTAYPPLSFAGSNSQGLTPHSSLALDGSKLKALTLYPSLAPTERSSQPLTSPSSLVPVGSNSPAWTTCPPLSNLPVGSNSQASTIWSNSQTSTTYAPLAENNSHVQTTYSPLAKSNPQSLASMPHQNPLPPLQEQVNPGPTSASWPHMNQSSTVFNPCADQRQVLATYAPGMNQQLSTTSLRPYANMPGVLSTENNEMMPGTSINRPHNYLVCTSNNNNGARLEVPNNAQNTGANSVSRLADSIFPPTVQAPTQQAVQTNTQPEKAVSTVPSIYVQQLRKYIRQLTNRPKDNNIQFWKDFVTEFYAPNGMRKNCWAAFPSLPSTKYARAKERSSCDHCQNYSVYINDIRFEELAIYNQYKFSSFKDERVKFGPFQEQHLVTTNVVLYFPCATENILENNFWSARQGPLAITFAANKKILSWQFCMRSCERTFCGPKFSLAPKDTPIGASESNSDQQRTQLANCIRITQTECELTKKLETNQSFENGLSARGTQTNRINGPRNTLILESDFMKQHKIVSDFLSNVGTAQPTLSSQRQGQPLGALNSTNFQMPQLLNPPYVAPTTNGSSPPAPSNPSNILKRAGSTENRLGTDNPEQRVTRQRLEDLSGNGVQFGNRSENIILTEQRVTHQRSEDLSGNGVVFGNRNENIASTEQVTHQRLEDLSGNGVGFGNRSENIALATDLTQGLAAYGNFNSNSDPMVVSGADPTEEQLDKFFESLAADGNIVSDAIPMHGFAENTIGQVNQLSEGNDSEKDLNDLYLEYLNQ